MIRLSGEIRGRGNVFSQEAAAQQHARRLQRGRGERKRRKRNGRKTKRRAGRRDVGRSRFITRADDSVGIANSLVNVAVVVVEYERSRCTQTQHICKNPLHAHTARTHCANTHTQSRRNLIAQICFRRVIEAQACPLVFTLLAGTERQRCKIITIQIIMGKNFCLQGCVHTPRACVARAREPRLPPSFGVSASFLHSIAANSLPSRGLSDDC